jgi:hypothetical protein
LVANEDRFVKIDTRAARIVRACFAACGAFHAARRGRRSCASRRRRSEEKRMQRRIDDPFVSRRTE